MADEQAKKQSLEQPDSEKHWKEKWKIPFNAFQGATSWQSILIGEDLMVAALKKSVKRSCDDRGLEVILIPDDIAMQAVRDVIGQLIETMREVGEEEQVKDAIDLIENTLKHGGSGSGDGDKLSPPPNP